MADCEIGNDTWIFAVANSEDSTGSYNETVYVLQMQLNGKIDKLKMFSSGSGYVTQADDIFFNADRDYLVLSGVAEYDLGYNNPMMFLMVIDAPSFVPNFFRTYTPGIVSQIKRTIYDKDNLSFFSLFYFLDHDDTILKWGVLQLEEFAGTVTWGRYLNSPGRILL